MATEIEFNFPDNSEDAMELRRKRITWKMNKPDENNFAAYTVWLFSEPNPLKIAIAKAAKEKGWNRITLKKDVPHV